jgi:hypothetical protein
LEKTGEENMEDELLEWDESEIEKYVKELEDNLEDEKRKRIRQDAPPIIRNDDVA